MRLALLAVVVAAVLSSAGAVLAADQNFVIRNHTGYQIDDVYLSRHSASEWGREVLGRGNVLVDGAAREIRFSERARGCHWDLRVQYHDNSTAEWSDLDLCEIRAVTLHYDRRRGVTRASVD